MGANHARVVATAPGADLAVVADCDLQRAERLAHAAGATAATALDPVLRCDAVIVACSTEHHVEVASACIEHGLPVLVEKPLASELPAAETLVQAAARHDVPLMCGFVERFNAAVTTASSLLAESPVHCLAIRHSPGVPRRIATSVVHDLLIHDIDLVMGFLHGRDLVSVTGAAPPDPATGMAEVADCTLQFSDGAVATLSASRASQRKIRSHTLATPSALVEVDLLRQNVTVYRNVDQGQVGATPGYRAETIVDIPFVRHRGEPLALQFEHFLRLVRGDADSAAERDTLLPAHRVAAAVQGVGAEVGLVGVVG